MVETLDKESFKVQKRSTSLQHTIPSEWADICGFQEEVETEAGLLHSDKHGYHLGIWRKKDQPGGLEENSFEERLAKNFSKNTKILIRELSRADVHKLVDRLADEIIHREEDGEIIKEPETKLERDYGETKEEIVEALRGE